MSYDPGDPWAPTLEVYNENEALTDATVSVTITAPDGVTSTPGVTHVSTGKYKTTLTLTTSGRWEAAWTVSGTVTGVETQYAYVRRLGSNVISLDDVKNALNATLTVDDSEIERMLDAAIAEYEEYVGPIAGPLTETYSGGERIVLNAPNVTAVTAVEYTDGTTVDVTDLDLDTRIGVLGWKPGTSGGFTWGVRNVIVTYTVGALPANHREAIIADVAGYFAGTQLGPTGPDEGYGAEFRAAPLVLFPRIRSLAIPAIA